MAKRTLLKIQDRQAIFDIPTDEDSLVRHYYLSPTAAAGGNIADAHLMECL